MAAPVPSGVRASGTTVDVIVTVSQGGRSVITVWHRIFQSFLLSDEADFSYLIHWGVGDPRTQVVIDDVVREVRSCAPRELIVAAIERAQVLAFSEGGA